MRVLLTGGSGQVGSALRESVPVDALMHAPSSRDLDIRSRESLDVAFAALRPDLVINAAAYTQVERAEEESESAMRVNGAGAGHVAAACAAFGCPLIHLSTDYVFDGKRQRPYREEDAPAPLNVYGRSKLAGEQAVRDNLEQHLILRVSWVFSATGSNFVKTLLGLAGRDELRVVNDQHGTPCAAAHIAAAIWRIAGQLAATPRFGTYHFASVPVTTWYEFAKAVYVALRDADPGAKVPSVVPITTREWVTRAARPRNSVLDSTRLRTDFGVSEPDWREELRSVVQKLVVG